MSAEYNLLYFGQFAAMAKALARITQGDMTGAEAFRIADEICVAHNAVCNIPMLRIEVARRVLAVGTVPVAQSLADATAEMIARTGEEMFASDLHRLNASVALHEGDVTMAEAELREAIAVARRQTAKLFEMRAGVDLARLLLDRGDVDAMNALIGEVTADLASGDCPDEAAAFAELSARA